MTISHAERTRRANAARTATIAATRPTTRPGSEHTRLRVGDKVRVVRQEPRSGTWGRYDGREGYVAVVNRQKFANGRQYVELGVRWTRVADWSRATAEIWFRADEVELVTR